MKLKKAPTKYIKLKIEQLVATFGALKDKMRECNLKGKKRHNLATGFDEGQYNFYQRTIESCQKKIENIKATLKKITSKYFLKDSEKKQIEAIASESSKVKK